MGRPLTGQQQIVYDFIRDKIVSRGYGPTVREIGEHMNIKSPNGVMCHLRALERKGMITRTANKSRAIELTEPIARLANSSLPIHGSIANGVCIAHAEVMGSFDLSQLTGEEQFSLQVQDDALLDSHICRNDIVVIHKQNFAKHGQLAVVRSEEKTGLYYWQSEGTFVHLRPASSFSPVFHLDQSEILGVVTAILRDLTAA